MTNIRDLMTKPDAREMEILYEDVLQEHNEQEERRVFDWEVDVPEFDF